VQRVSGQDGLRDKQVLGVIILLTIYVSFVALREALTSNTLIEAICAEFLKAAPKVCTECSACPDKVGCVTNRSWGWLSSRPYT